MTIVNVKNKKNGVTYVYESLGYWDKEKQQARSKRKCIGKLNNISIRTRYQAFITKVTKK